MNNITCDLCMDLMPLVHDGVASADSRQAVQAHIASCPSCKAMFEGELPAPANKEAIWATVSRKLRLFGAMVMMFGIFYGLMLTAGNALFRNILIMPAIGAIGYYLFRWRGLYIIPCLLLCTHLITNTLGLGNEYLDIPNLLLWTLIYCAIALVGFSIAALLHFVFRKENKT